MTKLSPEIPTYAASRPRVESENAQASRPHGKPPNGTEPVANSVATHKHGIQSIQRRCFRVWLARAPKTP
jgi:hypothetical protein